MFARWKTAAQFAAFALAWLGLSAVPAHAGGNQPFDVTLTGYVVEASGKSMPLAKDVVLKEHDIVFSGKLAWFSTADLAGAVSFDAVGTKFAVAQDAVLRLAVGVRGGDLADLSKTARTFCDASRHNMAKGLANLATGGILSLGARLRSDTQVCLVDKDANGDFDSAFVIGTKKAEDRHLVAIEPVRYVPRTLTPIDGDSVLEVEYLDGGALTGPKFWLNMRVKGEKFQFAALHMFQLRGFSFRTRVPITQSIKPTKLPTTFLFGAASLTVKKIDPVTRAATVDLLTDFRLDGFVIEPTPQTIYIFY
ncbi:MAG: hypothetical protein WCL10_13095 [Novosphingobium sp.]|uniref:hypothetical protein n=1 Tax=Novosphingobium sp. TaxID=1874826 RepID=UPI00301741F8